MNNEFENLPLFMTTRQFSKYTGEHVCSVRRGISEGRIPADKVNGHWLICKDLAFPTASGMLNDRKEEDDE